MAVRLVTSNGVASNGGVDRTLVRAIARSRDWRQEMCSQPSLTLEAIGQRENLLAVTCRASFDWPSSTRLSSPRSLTALRQRTSWSID